MENVVKHCLYGQMGAERHCYRFEFPLMRGFIYYHWLGKSRNDLDLFTLTEAALKGHNAREKLSTNNFDAETYNDL